MRTHRLNLDIALVVGFFGGVGSFFRGFRAYREYALLQNTPEIPIRSISMGLVRIHGKASSEQLVDSPVSHTPCCYYQVHIQKWTEGDNGRWSHYGWDAGGAKFYLQDSSGRVLVDARGAEYDIERTGSREAASDGTSSFATPGAYDTELLCYAARVGPSTEEPGSQHNLEMEMGVFSASNFLKQRGRPDAPFQEMIGPQAAKRQQQMQEAPEAEGPQLDAFRTETPLPLPPVPPADDAAASLADPTTTDDTEASLVDAPIAIGRYRFTERCILPGHEYDITGTCSENLEAKDVSDRNLIRKGLKEPTYLISGLARGDVNQMAQMRALLLIFGGGMLAVFCLALLLLRWGQF